MLTSVTKLLEHPLKPKSKQVYNLETLLQFRASGNSPLVAALINRRYSAGSRCSQLKQCFEKFHVSSIESDIRIARRQFCFTECFITKEN